MKTTKILQTLFFLLSGLLMSASLVFAWFIITFSTDEIIIDVGTLELDVAFFWANDANLDGVLDGGFTPIETMPFEEVFIPGQIYTFRITATNTGTVDGNLTLSVEDILMTSPGVENMLVFGYNDPTSGSPVQTPVPSGPLTLFSDYLMDAEETLTFDFTISVSTQMTSSVGSETITFTAFLIRLDQIAFN